jgi:hypothetical protein
MDNADAILTPSESYFALAWCSESDGLIPMLKLPRINGMNKQYKMNILIITRVISEW